MHPDHAQPSSSRFDRVESSVGAFFASVVVLMLGGLIAIIALTDPQATGVSLAAAAVIGALWVVLDVPYAIRLWLYLRDGRHPVALRVARTGSGRALPLRVFLMVWWTIHYLFGIVMVVAVEHQMSDHGQVTVADRHPYVIWMVSLVMMFSFAYVANGFLVMALTAAGTGDRWVKWTWDNRLALDAVIALAAFVVPSLGRVA